MWRVIRFGLRHELHVAREFLQKIVYREFVIARMQHLIAQHTEMMIEILRGRVHSRPRFLSSSMLRASIVLTGTDLINVLSERRTRRAHWVMNLGLAERSSDSRSSSFRI